MAFSPDGRRLATAGQAIRPRGCAIAPSDLPVGEDLLSLAPVQRPPHRRHRRTSKPTATAARTATKHPETTCSSNSGQVRPSPPRRHARAWREGQIAQCLREANLDAAYFHWSWLIAEAVTAGGGGK